MRANWRAWTPRAKAAIGAAVIGVLAAAGTGVAWGAGALTSSVPAADGTISVCYSTSGSLKTMYLIDPSTGATCPNGFTLLTFNQKGAQGVSGLTGPTGPTGPTGRSGSSGGSGPSGASGPSGVTGPSGPTGANPGFGQNTGTATAGNGAAECTLGEILLTAGSVASGALANGQLLSVSQNSALFYLYGFKYGGNGTSTFALPDLRSVTPNGMTYYVCVNGVFPTQ
jgi:hypothetical protein